MNQIWQRLWVGGLTDAQRLAKGNPNNIDTVISLCKVCVGSAGSASPKQRSDTESHVRRW